MADFDSSLPIRTETNGDVVVKVVDGTITSQQLTVNADGSVNITDNGGSLTVDATNLDIRDLTLVSDSVEVLQNTHDDLNANANIQVGNADVANGNPVPVSDAGGSLTVDATDFDIRDLTSVSDSVSVLQATHDNLNANANIQVNNTDVSGSNPVPVTIVDATPGTSITDYDTTANVAGGASDNHTYTSTGNFYLTQIEASASGKMKIEVQVNGTTRFVQFNSSSDPNMSIILTQPILATTGQTVVIIRTNRDNQAQDVYSTISGYNA